MMKEFQTTKWVIICGLVFMFLGSTDIAKAGQRHSSHNKYHHSRHHNYHNYHKYSRLPSNSISFEIGGVKFYYSSGHYYKHNRHGYVHIKPPIGACVWSLPSGYQVVRVGHKKYYKYNDVYYHHTPEGYVVIKNPTYTQNFQHKDYHKAKVLVSGGASDRYKKSKSIVINIPNKSGAYTSIKIIQSGDGYVGPQGEFYQNFPKVSELKVIYGS